MRAIHTMILAALTVNACSTVPPTPVNEKVTPALFASAQIEASRLSGGALSADGAVAPTIVQLPIGQICDLLGKCPHASAYDRDSRTAYFRDDRPWTSDRAHHYGIVIHEAAHTMQDEAMSPDCREAQAHEIQVAWLLAQGAAEMAEQVRENGERYLCETALVDAMPW